MSKFYLNKKQGTAYDPIEKVVYEMYDLSIHPITMRDMKDVYVCANSYASRNNYDCVVGYDNNRGQLMFVNKTQDNHKIFEKKINLFITQELKCDVMKKEVK